MLNFCSFSTLAVFLSALMQVWFACLKLLFDFQRKNRKFVRKLNFIFFLVLKLLLQLSKAKQQLLCPNCQLLWEFRRGLREERERERVSMYVWEIEIGVCKREREREISNLRKQITVPKRERDFISPTHLWRINKSWPKKWVYVAPSPFKYLII